ncbi:hypothetical protein IIV30_104L [Invertebrate iridescent virus 30]|uniref:Uncharacterized protein n=1 Tax=Invertebrate iridescent virus 30 TaxID=345585 RepID=W8W2X5_9VIRU|nr:hypothetical protein IIV30_104L [Invertebrate iridescent virus 30]CCV02299.1 hypothetical protein IIV30_104L [Invertebrate iridescent virus 30]
MASGINFKIHDPVAQLVATGGGGGGGTSLPLTGGTLTGNLVLTSPAKIIQSTAPTDPDDLTNKAYVDAKAMGYLPLAGGTMSGQIVQPLAPVAANDVANKAYVDGKVSTPNSIPGTSIVNNSITNTQLAPGAAAANINDGPDGSILPSKISGGPFLPLAGGTMSGAISQPIAPVAADDLTNKAYVDSKISTPNSIPGTSITNNSITNAQIAPGTITTTEIAPGTILGSNIAPGTITGANIAPATVANSNLVPGPASTIKGTNSLSNVDDFVIGGGLSLSGGAGPTLSVDPASLVKADNTQFGVVQFDPSGDLQQSSTNSGIAKVKQPSPGVIVINTGFDASGNFVSSKAGALVGTSVPDANTYTYDNLVFQIPTSSPVALQMKLVTGSGFVAGGGQPYWETTGPVQFVTGRKVYRTIDSTTFKYLSERVAGEPVGNTTVLAPWDTSTSINGGPVEIFNVFVEDGIDPAAYRITEFYFSPNFFLVIERLTG